MPPILYTYLFIMSSLGLFAFLLIILQFGSLNRTISLVKKYRHSKADNKADKKEAIAIIVYSILTAMLWLPLIVLLICTDIKSGNDRYFIIIRKWYLDGSFLIQGIMLAILFAITAFRNNKPKSAIYKISFCIYALCELMLTYSYSELLTESFLTMIGGIFLSVGTGNLIGTIIYKKYKS